MSSAAAWTVRS